MIRGEAISETAEPIYMVHGKWWDEGWYSDLLKPMEEYIKQFSCDRQWKFVLDSRQTILREFWEYSTKMRLDATKYYKHSVEWIVKELD